MRKIFTSLMMLGLMGSGIEAIAGTAVVTRDTHGIITDVTGGETRFFTRSSDAVYLSSSYYFQSGTTTIVVDGDDYYIQDPVCDSGLGTWVMGTLNSDGTKLVIPSNQPVMWSNSYATTVSLAHGDKVGSGWQRDDDDITYTIAGNTLSLDNASVTLVGTSISFNGGVLGLFWDDDNTLQCGEWSTVLTYNPSYVPPSTELVVLPSSAVVEEWYLRATDNNDDLVKSTVNVAFDGSDLYIQGIYADYPDAWIKGTISGSTVTFETGQYISDDEYDAWAVGFNLVSSKIEDFVMTYDAVAKSLTAENGTACNAKTDALYYYAYYTGISITAEEPFEPRYVPVYENTISSSDEFLEFTVIDANEDGKTWAYKSGAARYTYNTVADADDWLITSAVELKAGATYSFSVDVKCGGSSYPERVEVAMGTYPTVEKLGLSVIPATDVNNSSYKTLAATFTAPASGDFYFGIHAISDADQYYLEVDNISVAELALETVKLNADGYGTFSAAEDVTLGTSDVEVYKATISGETIVLSKLEGFIPAGTGVLLYSETLSNEKIDFVSAEGDVADVTGNDFLATTLADGSLADKTSDDTYVLGTSNEFLHYTGSAFVPNRAYLIYTGSAARLTVEFEDATGIRTIANEAQCAAVIDLLGRQTDREQGLQIRGGKVIMVK